MPARAPAARQTSTIPAPAASGPVRLPEPLPLTSLHLERIAQLEALVAPSRYAGWCWLGDDAFAVDVREAGGEGCDRYVGETLHLALGEAIRAQRGGARKAA